MPSRLIGTQPVTRSMTSLIYYSPLRWNNPSRKLSVRALVGLSWVNGLISISARLTWRLYSATARSLLLPDSEADTVHRAVGGFEHYTPTIIG